MEKRHVEGIFVVVKESLKVIFHTKVTFIENKDTKYQQITRQQWHYPPLYWDRRVRRRICLCVSTKSVAVWRYQESMRGRNDKYPYWVSNKNMICLSYGNSTTTSSRERGRCYWYILSAGQIVTYLRNIELQWQTVGGRVMRRISGKGKGVKIGYIWF